MDLDKIRELLKVVSESGVAEVEIEEDDFKMVVRRSSPNVTVHQGGGFGGYMAPMPMQQGYAAPPAGAASGPGAPPQQQQAPTPAPQSAPAPSTEEGSEEGDELGPNDIYVRAPIVGTFYRAPAPDADAFVETGDSIAAGDVVCIIEAMKIMNEIEAEEGGKIKKILVQNEEPVEYDQPLFIVERS